VGAGRALPGGPARACASTSLVWAARCLPALCVRALLLQTSSEPPGVRADACATYSQARHDASLRAVAGYCRQRTAAEVLGELRAWRWRP
jgi:hypothetical protein